MKKLFVLVLSTIYCFSGFCQKADDNSEKKQTWPLMIAINSHSYSWPIVKSFVTPIQPGIKIGTEYIYSEKGNHKFIQSFNLGYFRNPEFLNAYYFNSYFKYRYTAPIHLFFDGAIGAGYFHQRHTREVFKLNDKGDFESKTDWGSPGFQVGLDFSLGYNFIFNNKPYSFFIGYEWFVNGPHVKWDIPIIPHSLYSIGIRFSPFK